MITIVRPANNFNFRMWEVKSSPTPGLDMGIRAVIESPRSVCTSHLQRLETAGLEQCSATGLTARSAMPQDDAEITEI